MQSTLKTTKSTSKKRAKSGSDDEGSGSDLDAFGKDSLLSNTPPSAKKQKKAPVKKAGASKPLQGIENDSMQVDDDDDEDEPPKKPTGPKKSATDQYQKLSHIDHILKRPDTYIGSVERSTESMWGTYNLPYNYHIVNGMNSV